MSPARKALVECFIIGGVDLFACVLEEVTGIPEREFSKTGLLTDNAMFTTFAPDAHAFREWLLEYHPDVCRAAMTADRIEWFRKKLPGVEIPQFAAPETKTPAGKAG